MRTNETFHLDLKYRDSNGLPIDITDFTAKMQVRDKAGGAVVILDSEGPGSSVVIDGPRGKIDVYFPLATMLAVTAKKGFYDLVLTGPPPEERVDALIEGTVAFEKGVTV
jgi:hypothetical protein